MLEFEESGMTFYFNKQESFFMTRNLQNNNTREDVTNMSNTTTVNVNLTLDNNLLKSCEEIYAKLGLTLPTAINMFLHKTLIDNGIPFNVRLERYNDTTIAAMKEADMLLNDPHTTYYSIEDAIKELNK